MRGQVKRQHGRPWAAPGMTARGILNMTALAVAQAQEQEQAD